MMFDFGKKTFLGIDIGSSSIKMVEVKISGGKPYLNNYAWININNISKGKDVFSFGSISFFSDSLRRMLKEGKFKSKNANISIPAFGGLITLIEFPKIIEEDIEKAIRFEAHKYIPTPLEDVIFSWEIIDKKESERKMMESKVTLKEDEEKKDSEKMQVLLVAAPKNKVTRYEEIIRRAKLDINSVEIESFSLVRSLIGNDQGNFVILDIGLRICNIILVEKGTIKVNRNIDAGGQDITKTIIRNMDVDEKKAERMKMSRVNFFSQETSLVFPTLEIIANEIKRVIDVYYEKNKQAKIDAVILSGGTSDLAGLDSFFSKKLNIKTIAGNPFSRLAYDPKLEPVIKKIKAHFAVAIGLALRESEK